MIFLKRLYWAMALVPDWYFVSVDGDVTLRPAYWNGVIWENRTELLADARVGKVRGRVPSPHRAGA